MKPSHETNPRLGPNGSAIGKRSSLIALHLCAYLTCLIFFASGATVPAVAIVISATLIWVSVVDFECYQIPDFASLVLAATGLTWTLLLPASERFDHFAAAIFFPLVLYLVGYGYLRLRGHPGLGLGDVKLAFGLGAWLGLQSSAFVLLAASISGIATLLIFTMTNAEVERRISELPLAFGPFLCLFTWVFWLKDFAQ